MKHKYEKLACELLDKAKVAGANKADVIAYESQNINVRTRLTELETLESNESLGLALRVFVENTEGYKQAVVSTNDETEVDSLVERVMAMAKYSTPDKFIDLADASLFPKDLPELDLCDEDGGVSAEYLQKAAAECEQAAMDVKGITNSEGADAAYGYSHGLIASSEGFIDDSRSSIYSVSASVIAGEGDEMQTDYDYHLARHLEDLKSAAEVGRLAAEKTVKKMNPKKVESATVPVIFDRDLAGSILGSLSSAVNGAVVAKGTSFLADKKGEQIFAKGINIIDNPHVKRGVGSSCFDSECVAQEAFNIVEDGVLKNWLLDIRSANKMGVQTNGRASRGLGSAPRPASSNMYMENGKISLDELIADIKDGFYVTDAFGMGINGVTGDYSQGASGFWIENGKLTYAVSEVTIASNLLDMFANIIPANDLKMERSKNSPSLFIKEMTVAGA